MDQLQNLKNRHRYEVDSNGNIFIYKHNGSSFERLFELSELENVEFLVDYNGYEAVETLEDEININSEFNTCIVYYCRAKCYLEEGNIEMHNYYMQLFTKTLRTKNVTKRQVQVESSNYSLL